MNKSLTSLLFMLFSLLSFNAYTQFNVDDFKNMKFRNIGPAGMSGRITAIDVVLSNTNKIYVGSASGGLWLSENAGTSWKPIFDEQSTLAIGSIKINQNNPDEIWVGTGEGNPRNSLNTGRGIYKSLDGGKTWKCMGLENTKTIHRIIIDRDNAKIVYAAALGSPWGANVDRGVFKTEDGGLTWKKILYVDDLTGAADMVVDPSNPNKILVAMWTHKRDPWFFKSGGSGSSLYITYNGGDSFKRISDEDGLPKGELGRIGIAIAPSKSNIIYALVEAKENGLYKSTDGGVKWSLVSDKNIGDRPFYYSELYVDPKNENRIFNVFTYITRSEDGGKSFKNIADYGNDVHPDHHAFWIHPDQPEFMIDGNDGGLNISNDGGDTWRFVGNIPVGQFYHVNVDTDFPYNVYGGMQDNGSWVGPSAVLKRGGIRNNDFQELYFGDGFDVVPFRKDSRYGYAMSQGGNVGFYDRKTGETRFIKPNHPDPKVELRYNWNAAIAQDPFLDCGVYFGSQFVHYSKNCGESWEIISPDLTTNDTTRQVADKSGGLTLDATNAENYTTILAVAPSPKNAKIIWVGTDDGKLQLTSDGGNNWRNLSGSLSKLPEGSWIPQIHVSSFSENEAFVVANNYRRNDYVAYAYHTTDLGKTWTRIADDTQIKGFVLSIVQDHKEPNLLFLGTDAGLYVSFNKGKRWELWNKGFPQVQVADMKIHPVEDDLILGTFGRAIWILDDINPLRELAAKGIQILDGNFDVMATADDYLVSYRSYDGIRFAAQNEFRGDNRSYGRLGINVWLKPEKKSTDKDAKKDLKSEPNKTDDKDKEEKGKGEKDKPKEEKVEVMVYDNADKEIRQFKTKVEGGLNKITWGLEKNGVWYPSREEPKEDANIPGGGKVLPGAYKVVIKYKDWKDSTMVNVKMDKNSNSSVADLKAIDDILESYNGLVKQANEASTSLIKAKKKVAILEKMLDLKSDTIAKSYKKDLAKIKTQLDSLTNLFFEKENAKGIQRNTSLLNSVLYTAYNYINSSWKAPERNAIIALEQAKIKTNEVTEEVNKFITGDYKLFLTKMDGLDWKLSDQ